MYSRYFRYSGCPIKLLMVPYIAVLHVLWVPDIGTLDAMGALYRYPWLHKKILQVLQVPYTGTLDILHSTQVQQVLQVPLIGTLGAMGTLYFYSRYPTRNSRYFLYLTEKGCVSISWIILILLVSKIMIELSLVLVTKTYSLVL